jgi:SPP1 family predicted phage head-tail adaptor
MLQPGDYNTPCVIKKRISGRDDHGQPNTGWEVFDPIAWANIAFSSGLETIKGDAQVSVAKASVRMYFRLDLTADMQVEAEGLVFKVQSVLPDFRKREYVDLVCEVVSG